MQIYKEKIADTCCLLKLFGFKDENDINISDFQDNSCHCDDSIDQ